MMIHWAGAPAFLRYHQKHRFFSMLIGRARSLGPVFLLRDVAQLDASKFNELE
jgi:hypothetical protein